MNKREELEVMIGRQVAEAISTAMKTEIEPRDIMAYYVMAIGACMSVVFEDGTASRVKDVCGDWGKKGFTEARMSGIRR